MCLLSNDIHDYYFVSQGKTTIPNVDDGEEMLAADVSRFITPHLSDTPSTPLSIPIKPTKKIKIKSVKLGKFTTTPLQNQVYHSCTYEL